jgi:hypothetical protein
MVMATSVTMTMQASVMGPTLSSKKPTCGVRCVLVCVCVCVCV